MTAALYRATPADEWKACEIIGYRPGWRLVLREVVRPLPGVWIADLDQVRICGPDLNLRGPDRKFTESA